MATRFKTIKYAPDAWNLLQGVFCVYKPAGLAMPAVKRRVVGNLCRDLNQMEGRPPEKVVTIEDAPSSETGLVVTNVPSLADNVLVVGPRYQPEDFTFSWASDHGLYTSGLCVIGVNCKRDTDKLRYARYLKAYQLCGQFGLATEDFHVEGKIIEKSTFRHIGQVRFEACLASIQAAHQQHMFHYAGVDIKSQAAYDLASRGAIRPSRHSPPLIYGLRCIDFRLPDFTIEVQCINETESYLMQLVHDIGLTMKSTAACTRVRQTRFGHLGLQHALLRKHWSLEHVLNNMHLCRDVIGQKVYPGAANLEIASEPPEDAGVP